MSDESTSKGYDPITSNQVVISSSLAGKDWFGDVIEVEVDEEKGEVVVDKEGITREAFFQVLRKVSQPIKAKASISQYPHRRLTLPGR